MAILLFGMMGLTLVVIFNLLFFSALQHIGPMTSALILSSQPVVALIASSFLFSHLPTRRVLAGFMLAFSGVALVITKGQMNWGIFSGSIGEFLMLAAVISQVIYTLILRNVGTYFSASFIAFAVSVSCLIFLVPLMATSINFNEVMKLSATDWMYMGYIGTIGTTLGVVLFSLTIKHLGPALGSLVVFSTLPVTTMAYSFIIGQTPNTLELIGSICVLLGLSLGLYEPNKYQVKYQVKKNCEN